MFARSAALSRIAMRSRGEAQVALALGYMTCIGSARNFRGRIGLWRSVTPKSQASSLKFGYTLVQVACSLCACEQGGGPP